MTDRALHRLADTVIIEPLVGGWHAWSHLVSPVCASLHLLGYQLEILRSYVEAPARHVEAAREPGGFAGRYAAIDLARAGDMRALLERTLAEQGDRLELARALRALSLRIAREAQGHGLEAFYREVPEPLRGQVELVYDYHHRASVRVFEGLTYAGPLRRPDLESLRLSAGGRDGERAFFLNTPRLAEDGAIDWAVPFADPRGDQLSALEDQPQPLGAIRELLGLRAADDHQLLPLLTTAPARRAPAWTGDVTRARYFGHACVLLERRGLSILVDPLVSAAPGPGSLPRYTFADLPPMIDYALVTHGHADHFSLETLLRLRRRVRRLVVPRAAGLLHGDISLCWMARELGFPEVIELDAGESIPLPDGELTALPFLGEHGDLLHAKATYLVRLGDGSTLFGADTCCLEERFHELVRRRHGPVSTVFIGTVSQGAPLSWLYGPLFPEPIKHAHDRTRTLRGCDAVEGQVILDALGAQRGYVYALGAEPWLSHLFGPATDERSVSLEEADALVESARERGLVAERLFGQAELMLSTAR